ncbi:MAG: 4Fe-4S dicluster domain-containing protein [Thermodesulfovibrionales bacterium]|nr:4Fe-4S dicluster domain-containing protein [Thermodesulfovibrionales bacterium]
MGISRREFLKIAGASAIVGLGGISAIEILHPGQFEASQVSRGPKALVGKRWAMVIDMKKLDKQTMQKCIDACHRIHNVPDIEKPKEEIKWIWKETFEHAFPGQEHEYMGEDIKHLPLLVLCNQCDNPACVRVCPTKATYKREDGIVMMDMHRCIGCRFCMAACPFGARSFNWRDPRPFIKEENKEYPTRMKGVVEKCTFCYERLAVGLQPACVEESKGAIIFGDLEDPDSEVSKILHSKYTIRRKSELGTRPSVYYIV